MHYHPGRVPSRGSHRGRNPEGDRREMKGESLLWTPFRLRGIELRNRFVMLAHWNGLEEPDGTPSEDLAAYYAARARGGVGLITTGSQAIHPSGLMCPSYGRAWDRDALPAYRRLVEAAHPHGAHIFAQLNHGGHTSLEHPPQELWAPSQMPEPYARYNTVEMGPAEIEAVVEGFATSAANMREAGFDGVEIKVGHDGLLRSFVSPFFNRREDAYGGSFEKRMRLPLEVLAAMRGAVGPDWPISVRLCLHEYTSFGYDLDYGLEIGRALATSGHVDLFCSDAGTFSSFWMEIPPAAVPQLVFNELNAALKRATPLPVIAFGRIKNPLDAERILRQGDADLIGMARQLMADPELANKVRDGRLREVRPCIASNSCLLQTAQQLPVRCAVNPAAGRERRLGAPAPAATPRHVAVAGGGPAGLSAAVTLARRGHRVTLFERESEPGGLIRLAARQPLHAEIGEAAQHLASEAERLGVDLRLGVAASPRTIEALGPDAAVVATGSRPYLPGRDAPDGQSPPIAREGLLASMGGLVPGLADDPRVVSVDDVLSGRVAAGQSVVVLDRNAHWEACGTAEFLLEAGRRVEFVTPLAAAGVDLEPGNADLFYRRVRPQGLRIATHADIRSIAPEGVVVVDVHTNEERVLRNVDTIVLAVGRRSNDALYRALRERLPTFRIGDCRAPRLLKHAIQEGDAIGRALEARLTVES